MQTHLPFEVLLKYPFALLVGFLVTFLLTPVARRLSRSVGMVDQPRRRHTHEQPTPTGGGIALFLGFHAACFAMFVLPWAPFVGSLDAVWWWHFLLLSTVIVCTGILDDRFELKPLIKLGMQILVAVLAFCFDMRIEIILGVSLPLPLDLVLTVLWFVTIINAFNLIDGMDGLATGLALIASVGMAGSFLIRHMPADALVLIGAVGCCLAFLRYNFHPASIFLGDSGSMFLGFLLASVAVSSGGAKATTFTSIMVPFLAIGIPIFDTALAVWRRTVRGMVGKAEAGEREESVRVFTGDVDHVHHRLLRSGLSYRATATWLYTLAIGLVAVGLLSMLYHSHATGIYIIAFVAITYVVVRHLARLELWTSGQFILQGLHRPSWHVAGMIAYPVVDVCAFGLALAIGTYFGGGFEGLLGWKELWVDQLSVWVGVPFLCIFAARTYSRVWSRARISEFIMLASGIAAGSLIAAGITAVVDIISARALILQCMLHATISITLVAGIRTIPRAVIDTMAGRDRGHSSRRALLIGASPQAALYIMDQGLRLANDRSSTHILGYIDNDRQLHGRYVGGQLVHGGVDHLEEEIRAHSIDMLVVIDNLDDKDMQAVTTVADRNGIDVYAWQTGIRTIRRNRPAE
jgi:UDP-N-acetylmuramyl pentapeptide phosphotransferase/UDP-N-acetylglucosamine-1-phosphate transferase